MFREHAVDVGGRAVTVRMEKEFWDGLIDIAAERSITLSALLKEIIATIEGEPAAEQLASMLRVFVLEEVIRAASCAA